MDDSRQELKAIQDYLRQKAPRKYDERPIYYVYQHYNNRPERGELGCRWIGKGHKKRAFYFRRNAHYDAIFSKEFPPEVLFIAENLTEEEAFEIEKWMIANAKAAGVKLCNMTDGGEGSSGLCTPRGKHSEQHKQNLRLAWIKRKLNNNNVTPWKGLHHSDKVKREISNAVSAALSKPEIKKKMTENRSHTLAEQHKQNLSISGIEAWKTRKLTHRKRVWINRGDENKSVLKADLEIWLSTGWAVGRINDTKYRVWVYKDGKNRRVLPTELEQLFVEGWVLGRSKRRLDND